MAKNAVKKLKYRAFCAKIQNICAFALIEKEKDMNIIPKPHKYDKLGGEFTIGSQTKLFCEEIFAKQAQRFAEMVHESCGFSLTFAENIADAHIIFNKSDECAEEEYTLMIADGLATVAAADEKGCFYAVETLRQLFRLDEKQQNATYNNCYIEDRPKFAYRGLSVDICRHFFPLATLKQIVELMSRVKLNKLHLHLSDDQGFRLEVEKYPLLNSVGSVRSGSEVVENGVRFVDDKPVSGYLTKDEARQLVAFAAERMVEIIPEIDVPGHAVAMLAGYPQYCCEGSVSEVRKKWGISKDILCAGNDETYAFVKDILDEVCEVFPGNYVHLGGDEAPKDRWCNCKKCQEKVAELKLKDFEQLQTYMVEQFRKHLGEKGKTVICWNDGVHGDASEKIISQHWRAKIRQGGAKQANKGRKTIMSPFFKLYFDYPYALTPLKKTYKFNPLRGVRKSKRQNVLGVEGTMWTEYVSTTEKLFFNLLPRMLALSEVAWGTNTGEFAKRCNAYTQLYDKMGLTYFKKATVKVHKRIRIVQRFFRQNPNVELDEQNKNSEKQ